MKFRVLVELRGIPSRAWSSAAAWAALGDHYACPEPTPATVARTDLRRFHAVTWCTHPDLIPNVSFLQIPEHRDPNAGAELFLRPEEIIHHDLPLLKYRVEIEILEFQDWNTDSEDSFEPHWPDRWWSESEDEDDIPGLRDLSRSSPWPRESVFRRLGSRGSSGSSGDGRPDAQGATNGDRRHAALRSANGDRPVSAATRFHAPADGSCHGADLLVGAVTIAAGSPMQACVLDPPLRLPLRLDGRARSRATPAPHALTVAGAHPKVALAPVAPAFDPMLSEAM